MTEPSASTDFVLRNLRWVRQLARALVRDPGHADDLVQDAWLRVHRSPPPPGRRDRAWLARVLRNLARDSRRADSRRTRRELDSARPDRASTDEHLGDLASRYETLVQWLRELDEPYRRTLLLRWMEGQTPERIATEASVPIATVRTRLRRGEALLRERAERESHGRGQAWLAGLAVAPEGLLSPGRVLLTTMALMKLKIAAALALVTLAGWLALRTWNGPAWVGVEAPAGPVSPDDLAGLGDRDVGDSDAFISERSTAAAPIEKPVDSGPSLSAPDPAQDLVIQVVDEGGDPLPGVPVAIYTRKGGSDRNHIRATTDGEGGLARFENIQEILEAQNRRASGALFSVGLDAPVRTTERVPLERNALPAEPIVLVAPNYGSLEVHILHPDGSPFSVSSWVSATPLFLNPDQPVRLDRGERTSTYVRDLHIAKFPIVEAGIAIRIGVSDQGIIRGVERDLLPLDPDELRIVEIALGETHPHALGRILDPTGAPIQVRSFDVEFEPEGNGRAYDVGEDGSFVLALDRVRGTNALFSAKLEIELHGPTSDRSDDELLTGSFTARKPLNGGSIHVGDIVMRPAPVLVGGHVVDADGAPVKGAYISIYEKFNQREDPEDFDWNFAGVDYVYTDASGAFSVLGDLDAGEYALRALGTGWVDRGAVRFQSGSRGVEVVVDRAHFIAGRVQLPDGVDPRAFQVEAVVPGASREQQTYARWESGIESDGSFELGGVRPGPSTLQLKSLNDSLPIASIADIVPTSTMDEEAEGVAPWDLTEQLRALSFIVHLADGQPAERCWVGLGATHVEAGEGTVKALINTATQDEVLVIAPGHLPARFSSSAMPERVNLERGRGVTVRLSEVLPELPEGWLLSVELSPEGPIELPADGSFAARPMENSFLHGRLSERIFVDPQDTEWTLHAPVTGSYRPTWRVMRPAEDPVVGGGQTVSFTTESGRREIQVEQVHGPAMLYEATVNMTEVSELIDRLR